MMVEGGDASWRLRVERLSFRGVGWGVEAAASGEAGRRWRIGKVLPGEEVVARPGEAPGWAVLVEVVKASGERCASGCAQDLVCPGCQLRAMREGAQRTWKREQWRAALWRLAGIGPERVGEVVAGALSEGYRQRASVQWVKVGGDWMPTLGASGVDLRRCPAQCKGSRALLAAVSEVLGGWPDAPGRLAGRVAVGAAGARVGFVLERGQVWPPALVDVAEALASRVDGVSVEVAVAGSERARTLRWERVLGDGRLVLGREAGGLLLTAQDQAWTPVSWANAEVVRGVLLEMLAEAQGGGRLVGAVEVGCGVGTHSFAVAEAVGWLVGIDASRAAIASAEENAARAGVAAEVVRFRVGHDQRALRRIVAEGCRAELLVLHGMRRPYGDGVCGLAGALGARVVLVVAPGVYALAGDVAALRRYGYALQRIAVVDTLPHTYHAMAVAWLRRGD